MNKLFDDNLDVLRAQAAHASVDPVYLDSPFIRTSAAIIVA